MRLYASLSKIKFLNTYAVKFLFVAFLGIHIPLIGIIFFIAFNDDALTSLEIILYTLGLTLLATAITLFILHKLIRPIIVANRALRNYITAQQLPNLPMTFTDEVGVLLQDIQNTVTSVDNLLQEKKDLVSMLSHDLRTPTITTLDTVRLLRENPEEQQQLPAYLDNLETVGKKQLELMDSVLTLLRQEDSLTQELVKKPMSLALLVRGTILQLQLPLVAKRLQVKQEIPAELMVSVEATLFGQVLSNVLVNAIKFSNQGQAITLKAEETPTHVLLHLQDTGLGFAPEVHERLFDRFTQYRQVGTAGEATNGIGLFLCQKIMQRHGGTITAHSAGRGQGSTFTLQIPKG
ncbi:sensor histidine kinase KdpD [Rufibacter sp. LB8]|uniref:sensor histidine kinase n=1 Tax=Rufibacter sp. LB8 TaxID=2777781 RepID=UPI00178C24FD|nr:HAMP domain-containing sensor histidine kinase [Rufibacter sp. LB8]